MQSIQELIEFVGPSTPSSDPPTGARRLLLAAEACMAALVFAAVWGIAAGSHPGRFAFDNGIKVPMLLLVSCLAALPAGVAAFRLTARFGHAADIVLGHAAAMFAGTLILALLAPLVALYQYSSSWAGPAVALASAVIGGLVGGGTLLRVLGKLLSDPRGRRAAALPVTLLVLLQLVALLQLASMTSPVFPQRTRFGQGIDGLHHQVEAAP
jgi:hypothetical protein